MGVRRQFFPSGITMMRRDARRSERFFRASLFICSCPGCNPGHRLSGRGLCSPPPAKAYGFVSGSKIFTEDGGGNRPIAGVPAGAFAPRRPQRHTASFRGAKSSQRTAAEIVLLPACRPPPLLPAARKGLRLRFGEQKVHRVRRRKSSYCRRAGRGLCSPPPAKAYGFVSGSKKFTEGGGGKRLIAGSPAAAFAPRRPQRLTAPFLGAKSSQRAAAENALSPAEIPFLRRRYARWHKMKKGIDII